MIIYDFVIRGFICSSSPVPFFSYITFASARKRLLNTRKYFLEVTLNFITTMVDITTTQRRYVVSMTLMTSQLKIISNSNSSIEE